jgi:hypothetical protein
MAQDEDKGIIGTLADVFDECAEAVEELTGKPADGLRKGARVCRKTRKTARSIEAAVAKAQKVAIKTQNNSSIPKLIHKIKNTKIVGFQPYPDQPGQSGQPTDDESDPIHSK